LDEGIVRIENVSYRHLGREEYSIEDVSAEIQRGEFVALIGQNGSGKSTLANLIVGLLKPAKGRILVEGVDTRTVNLKDISTRIGFVFQNPDHQLFTRRVWDEVAFGPRNLGVPQNEIDARVSKALETVNLLSYKDAHPQSLSRGERRRLATATVLVSQPRILLLDEPTTGQDYGNSRYLAGLVAELNRAGLTVIMITHDMKLVAECSQRVILLQDGRIAADLPTRELFCDETLLESVRLRPPLVTRLTCELNRLGFKLPVALTVDELVPHLRRVSGSQEGMK
jgi:energy-coupling factor transporter ATP-binding protein EcfA2